MNWIPDLSHRILTITCLQRGWTLEHQFYTNQGPLGFFYNTVLVRSRLLAFTSDRRSAIYTSAAAATCAIAAAIAASIRAVIRAARRSNSSRVQLMRRRSCALSRPAAISS